MTPLDVGTWAQTAVGGSMALALPVALLAGLVAFFSPCVVPLLPGYLSYATGLAAAEVVEGSKRHGRMLAGASLFVLGFAVVFVLSGVIAGSAGRALLDLLVARAAERGLPAVELHAQVHARGFYERAGFVPFGEVYLEAGIEHLGMRRDLTG